MLARAVWISLAPLLVLACTAGASGPELWAEACARSLAQTKVSAPELSGPEAQAECEQSMLSHPRAVADDMGRCIMKGEPAANQAAERAAFRACISAQTQTYLDRREAAWRQLDALAETLDGRASGGALPASLAELPGAEGEGPWGHSLHYQAQDLSYELCVVGPDGELGTPDDSCHNPAFIYFQF